MEIGFSTPDQATAVFNMVFVSGTGSIQQVGKKVTKSV